MPQTTPGAARPQALFLRANPGNDLAHATSTNIGSFALRFFAIGTGAAILAASTNAVVTASKLAGPDAALVWALAAGIAAGAVVVPRAKARLAAALVAALLCGEAFNLLSAAERIVNTRAGAASAVTGNNTRRSEAATRLQKAELALSAQRAAAMTTVAQPACARECRALLQAQAAELDTEVQAARDGLANAPAEQSATPLADRLGVAGWLLDLIAAGLLSVGANGLAAILIAWGAAPRSINAVNSMLAAVPGVDHANSLTAEPRDEEPPTPPTGGHGQLVSPRTRGVLALIENAGGTVAGSQREIAERIGVSKTTFARALAELRSLGIVTADADKALGTRISLVTA